MMKTVHIHIHDAHMSMTRYDHNDDGDKHNDDDEHDDHNDYDKHNDDD